MYFIGFFPFLRSISHSPAKAYWDHFQNKLSALKSLSQGLLLRAQTKAACPSKVYFVVKLTIKCGLLRVEKKKSKLENFTNFRLSQSWSLHWMKQTNKKFRGKRLQNQTSPSLGMPVRYSCVSNIVWRIIRMIFSKEKIRLPLIIEIVNQPEFFNYHRQSWCTVSTESHCSIHLIHDIKMTSYS